MDPISMGDLEFKNNRSKIKSDEIDFKIKKISQDSVTVNKWLEDQFILLKDSVFEAKVPYRGQITNQKSCADKLKPKVLVLEAASVKKLILYTSNKRFVQSTCLNREAFYRTVLTVLICGKISYKLKAYLPLNSSDEEVVNVFKQMGG